MKLKLIPVLTVAGLLALGTGNAARADSFQLSLGYADNTHGTPSLPLSTLFNAPPNVLNNSGLSKVVVNGVTTSTSGLFTIPGLYDGSAFKIVNTSGSTLSLSSFKLTVTGGNNPTSIEWDFAAQTIAAGKTLVLTQETLFTFLDPLAATGANTSFGEFLDLSEFGPTGELTQGHGKTFNAPVVSFNYQVGAGPVQSYSYTDSQGVLFGNQPDGRNETHDWVQTVPEPASALLGMTGFGLMAGWRWRRRKAA